MSRSLLFNVLSIAFISPGHAGSNNQIKGPVTGSRALNTGRKINAPDMTVRTPGIHQQIIRGHDGADLRFTISVPAAHSSKRSSPLIVALHFGGHVTAFYGRGVPEELVAPALESLNANIVTPDSVARRWKNKTNEAAVIEIVDGIIASYNIDEGKLLVTGCNMGGQGAWFWREKTRENSLPRFRLRGVLLKDSIGGFRYTSFNPVKMKSFLWRRQKCKWSN